LKIYTLTASYLDKKSTCPKSYHGRQKQNRTLLFRPKDICQKKMIGDSAGMRRATQAPFIARPSGKICSIPALLTIS
ncbi:MAG: hypothetical protein JXB49_01220, partial [Bacteroidales bacterium]|nr:hypothetical protein [Bacteroidales bacterium]